jgi:hypothetical protein
MVGDGEEGGLVEVPPHQSRNNRIAAMARPAAAE